MTKTDVPEEELAHPEADATDAPATPATPDTHTMPRRLVLVFAIACGVIVANNYYAQPLLATIARDFATGSAAVGQIVTLTQIGYAFGLLLLVPLGDLMNCRRLIVAVLVGTALALLACALAPALSFLIAFSLAVGLTTVVAQMLVPFAASLAGERERGQVVGLVMSGLLFGILLARTFSGLIGQAAGWRVMYALAAALMVVMIALLWHELPADEAQHPALTGRGYARLLGSVWTLVREEPLLRRRSFYGACCFAAFSVLWTSIAFLLARPPYGYGEAVIGLFGLVGAAGALCASLAGRWADRGWSLWTTGSFLLLMLVAFAFIWGGAHSLAALIAGIVLLDMGVQGTHITNQSEIYRLHPEARSRLTTAYMTTYFIGGALGSAISALVYSRAGWGGVSALGGLIGALALLLWLNELRTSFWKAGERTRV